MALLWHPSPGMSKNQEVEVLADYDRGDALAVQVLAVVESFGYGWYASALPPLGDGQSYMFPGMVRSGCFGENVEGAKAWAERICGLLPEKEHDRGTEGGR